MIRVLNLQKFIVRYIREPLFMEKFLKNQEIVYNDLQLNNKEVEIIEQINIELLNKVADDVFHLRKKNRITNFFEFYLVMERCNLFDELFLEFSRNVTKGRLTPEIDAPEFYKFSYHYLESNKLPKILKEILVYSFYIFKVSQEPSDLKKGVDILETDKELFVKSPYYVKRFDYDIANLLNNNQIDLKYLNEIRPKNKIYLFQKDYFNPKSCNVFEIDDAELFKMLLSHFTMDKILRHTYDEKIRKIRYKTINECFEEGIIGI